MKSSLRIPKRLRKYLKASGASVLNVKSVHWCAGVDEDPPLGKKTVSTVMKSCMRRSLSSP